MNDKNNKHDPWNLPIVAELLTALSEDYSVAQLEDEQFMREELEVLIKATPEQAKILARGARDIKIVRREPESLWRSLVRTMRDEVH